MTGTSYFDLLRLTAPEIIVALAGLLLLVLDLGFLRRATLAMRFRSAIIAGCIACVIALIVLGKFSQQGALPAEDQRSLAGGKSNAASTHPPVTRGSLTRGMRIVTGFAA